MKNKLFSILAYVIAFLISVSAILALIRLIVWLIGGIY